jgi:hypothetical protein
MHLISGSMTFPLFERTAGFSWKKGGQISRAWTAAQREDEASLLLRALG